jgi:hypothetical protein
MYSLTGENRVQYYGVFGTDRQEQTENGRFHVSLFLFVRSYCILVFYLEFSFCVVGRRRVHSHYDVFAAFWFVGQWVQTCDGMP